MKISFIIPSRNNLKYLKWAYESIRKNQGNHEVEICVADDFSNDGTWDWCLTKINEDSRFKGIRHQGPTRLGHTILYDRLVNEVASHDIAIIYHADMYLCPGALDAIEEHIKPKTIVSLTRIEPPLHPSGPEKITRNFGTEPEEFNETGLLEDVQNNILHNKDKTTEGVFAPWAFYRKDFQEIGGHDPLYAPQSKEDSDIFNRFQLNGVSFIQTWKGFVYHMTCRGSRFNPTITQVGKESSEWLDQNLRSSRNFVRKWGHFVKHDKFMKPIIPHKYNIQLRLFNATLDSLYLLEPWFSSIVVDSPIVDEYVDLEQKNTLFNLRDRVFLYTSSPEADIIVRLQEKVISKETMYYINLLPEIIAESGNIGKFKLGNLEISIFNIRSIEKELINVLNKT